MNDRSLVDWFFLQELLHLAECFTLEKLSELFWKYSNESINNMQSDPYCCIWIRYWSGSSQISQSRGHFTFLPLNNQWWLYLFNKNIHRTVSISTERKTSYLVILFAFVFSFLTSLNRILFPLSKLKIVLHARSNHFDINVSRARIREN